MIFEQVIQKRYGKKGELNDYLSVHDGILYYKEVNLLDLAEKYKTPLEVAYTDIIRTRITELQQLFADAIEQNKYSGKYIYAYATKANYYSEVVTTALNDVDAIETSSSYDLDIVENLFERGIIKAGYDVICNGFKQGRYFEKIVLLQKKGLNVIPVLESKDEVEMFLNDTELEFEIGMRINIDEAVASSFENGNRLGSEVDTRFGLFSKDMFAAAEQIADSQHLTLTTTHLHLGGTVKDTKKYIDFLGDIYTDIFAPLQKLYPTVRNFDFGGGLPAQYDLDFDYDYAEFANLLVEKMKTLSDAEGLDAPDLIGEHGRYTVTDHGFSIFEIDLIKETHDPDVFWYLINSSLMNFLPDSWALGQDFIVLPINGWDLESCKVKLGGKTCDPDDTYYKKEKNNLLDMPIPKEGEKLYIGIFGVGSYQEMISGVGGVHHCLLPEGNEVIIYSKDGELQYDLVNRTQTPEAVLKVLDYHGHTDLERYTD